MFGLRQASAGSMRLDGRPYCPRHARDAIDHGIGFVGEDRRLQGIVPDFTVRENLMLAHVGAHRVSGLATLNAGRAQRR